MTSPEIPNNQAMETLLSVQETLVETINLLDVRADQLVESQATLTEQRALLNTVKGMKSLVEIQIRSVGGVK